MISRVAHLRSFSVNLASCVEAGCRFIEEQQVLPHMTTNRTGRPGDDIFCTPMMIEHMNELVMNNMKNRVPGCEFRTLKVSCAHKAPLALGEAFVLEAQANEVLEDAAKFRVLCTTTDRKKVIGDAQITIKVVKC